MKNGLCKFILLQVLFLLASKALAQPIVVGINALPSPKNPHFSRSTNHTQVLRQIYEPLFILDSNFRMTSPYLEWWKVENGGKRYVLKLKSDSKFSDGSQVTAASVVDILKRLTPNGDKLFPNIRSVQVKKDEIRIDLSLQDRDLLSRLTDLSSSLIGSQKDLFGFPIGTGAYKPFEITATKLIVTRNPNHRDSSVGTIQSIVFQKLEKSSISLNEILSLKVDFFPLVHVYDDIDTKERFQKVEYPSQRLNLLVANIPDKEVRFAIRECINWKGFSEFPYFKNRAIPYDSIIPPGIENFVPRRREAQFNQSCSKAISRISKKRTVKLINTYEDQPDQDFIKKVVDDFNRLSVKLKIEILNIPIAEAHKIIQAGKHELFLCGVGSPYPRAEGIFSDFLAGDKDKNRLITYRIPGFTSLISKYQKADEFQRPLIIGQINDLIVDNAWALPIALRKEEFYVPKNWRNLQLVNGMNGNFYLGKVVVVEK